MVHEVAAAGFADATDYEASRPSYPPGAVAWIVDRVRPGPGRPVCDLAAGTGKLTRLLVGAGLPVVAVEPVAGMRAAFRAVLPSVPLVAGTAEAMPFADGSLAAVTVAQAFHWFDHARTSAELVRVVPRGGVVTLCWNARDRSLEWADAVWTIIDRVEKRAPWRDHENWREAAPSIPGFERIDEAEFHHEHALTPDAVVRRVASVSHVAVLPDAERAAVLEEVRGILRSHPQTRDREVVHLRYRVDCVAFART
jgi:SAM-dependent methyltransferase